MPDWHVDFDRISTKMQLWRVEAGHEEPVGYLIVWLQGITDGGMRHLYNGPVGKPSFQRDSSRHIGMGGEGVSGFLMIVTCEGYAQTRAGETVLLTGKAIGGDWRFTLTRDWPAD